MQLLKIGVDVSFFKKQEHQIKYGAVLFLYVGKGIFRIPYTQPYNNIIYVYRVFFIDINYALL